MNLPKEILQSIPFQYAEAVKSEKILTGEFIKLAIDRFYKRIDQAQSKNYMLDHAAGMHVIEFFELFIKHTKGLTPHTAFVLSPYQQFTLYNIFAWKKQNSKGQWVRLTRTIYEKVARKNGKTALLAALGLYCQSFDLEPGAEIYVGATKEAQAKICWEQAVDFVNNSGALRSIGFRNTQREIKFFNQAASGKTHKGVFRFLGGDSKTLDGLSPSVAIIDEYHAHPTDSVREVLESAMGARKQPIMYIITTAGFNTTSVCKHYEDVCIEILKEIKEDDSTFIMMHDLDQDDDWENPDTWSKANPNLGISVSMEFLQDEYQKAINQPSKIPNFKTKHLNKWVDAQEVWIPDAIWQACKYKPKKSGFTPIPLSKFKQGSTAAIDLATTTDITAYIKLSQPDAKGFRYLTGNYFCPSETIDSRSKTDRVPYRYWKDAGYLTATEGNTTDYEVIRKHIIEENPKYNVENIAADQWNASEMTNRLAEDDISMTYFPQAISVISYPTKQFEKLLYEKKIIHDGNPILRWMLSGCVIIRDPNENIKVHKGKSNSGVKRVDGIVASIMALGEQLSDEDTNQSKYNNPNVEVFV